MRYLVRMVTPPGGVCLDPFMGSGTTGCACALDDYNFIGIDLMPEHVKIAEARIAYWQTHELGDTPKRPRAVAAPIGPSLDL